MRADLALGGLGAVTNRIAKRPLPDQWRPDEPMTLKEYLAVFWPDGPITESALRAEIGRGALPAARVGGRFWITPAAAAALFQPGTSAPAVSDDQIRLEAAKARAFAAVRALRPPRKGV